MNIRIVALCLLFVTTLGLAQESKTPAKSKRAEHAAMLETLQRGKQISINREQYQFVPEVLAVERVSDEETPQQAMAQVGASGQPIETKGKLVLFRAAQQKRAFVERVGSLTVYPAVLNVRTGTFAVLTGALVVRPKSMSAAGSIANRYGLETVWEFPHLRTVFYRVKANVDIIDIAAALQTDPLIEDVYPEIIEHVLSPK
jgi:hypothetical protein